MKVYLDNCCYNRLLDDRSYSRIYYERNSVMLILELAESGEFDLVGSEMLVREIADTRDAYRRSVLQMIYGLCRNEIQVNDAILNRAEEIRHNSSIKYKDSIHLACAEAAGADVLVTTDEKFMKNASRIKIFTRVLTPGEWLLEVLYQ